MGKAAKQRLEAKKRLLFETHGDDRSVAERAKARAMLDALQKKLDDDALREDGFCFLDGAYVAARKPRTTSGMKMRSFDGHRQSVKGVALVNCCCPSERQSPVKEEVPASFVVTFGLDRIGIWDFRTTEQLASLDVSDQDARFVCGAAVSHQQEIRFAYATPKKSDSTGDAATLRRLELVRILPVHGLGASCARFTLDDQQLVTTGECTVKIWEVAVDTSIALEAYPESSAYQGMTHEEELQSESEVQRRGDWDAAIPYSLSVERSMRLLAFDDTLSELVSNHEWQHRSRDSGGRVARLLRPDPKRFVFLNDAVGTGTLKPNESADKPLSELDEKDEPQKPIESEERVQTAHLAESTRDTASVSDLSPNDDLSVETDAAKASQDQYTSTKDDETRSASLRAEPPIDIAESISTLSPDDAEYLERYYRDLTSFDFEQLLNPALPLRLPYKSAIESEVGSDADKENQDESSSLRTPQPEISLSPHPVSFEELIWSPLQPDASGKLIQTFGEYDARGIFSAHTSQISCCAVSKERGIVVTVAFDKMLKFWSLADGRVLETVRDAHTAPVTCCALTSEPTHTNPDGVLVATGGKDNLVKVWRRSSSSSQSAAPECVYSFSGHYDAITSCTFDSSGVFLLTTGDDTNVIAWRVVPASPDQPNALRLVSVDEFAITVSWDEPLANGSPLLHYVIRTTQVSSLVVGGHDMLKVPDAMVPAKYASKTIDVLEPGIQYTLQIAAVNAIGSSPFSDVTAPIETLAFVPSRIESPLQYSDREATRVRLSWKQPSPNGALIQSFTIRCLPENSVFVPVLEVLIPIAKLEAMTLLVSGSAESSVDASKRKTQATTKKPAKSTKKTTTASPSVLPQLKSLSDVFYSYMVEGLWPGEIYQFVAAAENRCGIGAFSRVSDYVKMDPTAPDPPGMPLIVNIQQRQVGILWEKPKCNGSEILQYTLEWIQDDRLAAQDDQGSSFEGECEPMVHHSLELLTRSIPGTSYTLQGLEPGKPLRVWLSASNLIDNKICTSALSSASEVAATLCDVPDKPARPELGQPTSHTLVLAFAAPKCNGLEIESYDVLLYYEEVQFGITNRQVFRESRLTAADCQEQKGSHRVFTLEKLRGKTHYSVKLCAVNALGTSLMSDCSELVSTKPPTVPARMLEPPAIVDVEPTKASITWGTPEHDGGAPLVAFHLLYSAQPSSTYPCENEKEDEKEDHSANGYKALFDNEVTIYQGRELLATFLKPKTSYRFRVASSNAVGKAAFSKKSVAVHTPSLVEFTISRYFADRPEVEHVKARYIQKRYRAWKLAVVRRKRELDALKIAVESWHML